MKINSYFIPAKGARKLFKKKFFFNQGSKKAFNMLVDFKKFLLKDRTNNR